LDVAEMVEKNIKNDLSDFIDERENLNKLVLQYSGKNIKRFYGLDSSVYRSGALPAKTKELIGLVASLVLRCGDCVKFHLNNCHSEGVSDAELEEALAIGLLVGGSITIPELRHAFQFWDKIKSEKMD
jgi:AhpD family alkylhydroperoxidase